MKNMYHIPEVNPESLEECLNILGHIKYESYGFPMFFLDFQMFEYGGFGGKWACVYRNPKNFSNPDIKEETPLKACHKMLDFLKEEKLKRKQKII